MSCRGIAGTGLYAVYAFCREVDDIADGERRVEHKLAALADWREEIDALYGGRPQHLVARALREPALRYDLRRQDFLAIIDGMEMDAREHIRAPDLATLDLYCGRVASAVGHLSVHVFGDSSDAAHAVAESLGRALQLTNILRDLAEDATRHRLYLPREILDRHGIRGSDPIMVLRHPGIAGGLPRCCRNRRRPFSGGRAGYGAMRAPCHASRRSDGRRSTGVPSRLCGARDGATQRRG